MAVNQKRRQKKLMKKRQKDKARKSKPATSDSFSLLSAKKKILTARNFPVYECLIDPSWQERGMAQIIISRQQPDGDLVFGVYLVDIFCLGLKNTFCNADFSMWKYKTELREQFYGNEGPVDCPIPLANNIIYGAIEFAAQFGFKPNKDFKLSQYVLEDKNSVEPCDDVEFGKDGKPFYITGPEDNVERILKQLELTAGSENFDFMFNPNDPRNSESEF
jgi:hypothetical protein